MVISNKHKVVFIHIPRTAGTFITKYLTGINGFKKVNLNGDTHFSVFLARDYIGNSFDDYYRFMVVRNPWDYYASLYFYTRNSRCHEWRLFGDKDMSFKDWLKNIVFTDIDEDTLNKFKDDKTSTATLYKKIYDSNLNIGWFSYRVIYSGRLDWEDIFHQNSFKGVTSFDVDILFQESLRSDLKNKLGKYLDKRNLNKIDSLKAINASNKPYKDYRFYYDSEMVRWVYERDWFVINRFGYEFES